MSIAAVNAFIRSFAQLLATSDYHAPGFISAFWGRVRSDPGIAP
ncbi:hypothetical protein RFN29_33145 [Mesorhizobium sp. VK22B]|uniref:Uncharacterized protein n=1 Tax=Mesorhizobium captivum TaxID=3072319 RepID=A0ABU4ZEI6_9HYPH|nr:hypothetical protein [Mesorhizobium sp. VK22B]MDX8496372.1 hypothetical protein [Mesorhizobium sp. VK22B]